MQGKDWGMILMHLKIIWTQAATGAIRRDDCPRIADWIDDTIQRIEQEIAEEDDGK